MAKRMSFNLTDEEKKRLRRKKISQKSLENYSINEIAAILEVDIERARRIVYESINMSPMFPRPSDQGMQKIAAAFNPLKSLGPIAAILETQRRIDQSLRPFQSLGMSLARELAETKKVFTATGMASILANIDHYPVMSGSASKLIAASILGSETYNQLRVTQLAQDVVLKGFYAQSGLSKIAVQIAGMNDLTNRRLGAFEWAALGSRLQLENSAVMATQKHFMSFSSGYAAVLKDIVQLPKWAEHNPLLAKLPSIEFDAHSTALEVISTEDEDFIERSSDQLAEELIVETSGGIEIYLPKLHAGFPKMWTGALQALQSTNVDRIRHFNVSVRELFTHVIHMLAPDDSIQKWSVDEKDFTNGRSTRKARLVYICRNIQGGAYQKFLAKDIAGMLELIDLFQQGTHGIEPDFTEQQLHALRFRVESALRFLLEIEFTANR
ncbi:MAG: hypothetical protein JWQ34_2614 [Mucilaginibacter sp.]|nr:hypothetical protein [Mucilaginibacter sp.]